jgi:hypothetical protein
MLRFHASAGIKIALFFLKNNIEIAFGERIFVWFSVVKRLVQFWRYCDWVFLLGEKR